MPGAGHRIHLALFEQFCAYSNGGILFAADGGSGRLAHFNHGFGVNYADAAVPCNAVPFQIVGQFFFVAYYNQFDIGEIISSLSSTLNAHTGGIISAHGVYGDFHKGAALFIKN